MAFVAIVEIVALCSASRSFSLRLAAYKLALHGTQIGRLKKVAFGTTNLLTRRKFSISLRVN